MNRGGCVGWKYFCRRYGSNGIRVVRKSNTEVPTVSRENLPAIFHKDIRVIVCIIYIINVSFGETIFPLNRRNFFCNTKFYSLRSLLHFHWRIFSKFWISENPKTLLILSMKSIYWYNDSSLFMQLRKFHLRIFFIDITVRISLKIWRYFCNCIWSSTWSGHWWKSGWLTGNVKVELSNFLFTDCVSTVSRLKRYLRFLWNNKSFVERSLMLGHRGMFRIEINNA